MEGVVRVKPFGGELQMMKNFLSPTASEVVAHINDHAPPSNPCNRKIREGLRHGRERCTDQEMPRCQSGNIIGVDTERAQRSGIWASFDLGTECGELLEGECSLPRTLRRWCLKHLAEGRGFLKRSF